MKDPVQSYIDCPICGDCKMDDHPVDNWETMLECPQCGVQYRLEYIGETDTPRCPEGV